MDDVQARLGRLSPEQRRLFELRSRRAGGAAVAPASADELAVPGAELHHLAPWQELGWHQALTAGPGAFNGPLVLRLRGELDVALFEQAMAAVVSRHPALRTTIVAVDGRPFQRFLPEVAVPLPLVDLTAVPEAEREARARDLARDVIRHRFDLSDGTPLWVQRLFRLGPTDHVWALTFQAMVADGESRGIIVDELLEFHAALREGRPPRLPAPRDYFAVVGQHRAWTRGPEAARLRATWRSDLAGITAAAVAADRPRPAVKSFRGTRNNYVLADDLLAEVTALGEREGATLYMVLLAAFATLLSRYTGRTDVAVTTFISTREHAVAAAVPAAEGLVGVFVNPVLQRCRWSGDVPFRELLAVARSATLGAQPKKDVPVVGVLREIGWEGDRLPSVLCQFMLGVFGPPPPPRIVAGLDVRPFAVPGIKSEGDLGVFASRSVRQQLAVQVEYDTDIFRSGTVDRFWGHLTAVLRRAAGDAEQRLSGLLAGIGELAGAGEP